MPSGNVATATVSRFVLGSVALTISRGPSARMCAKPAVSFANEHCARAMNPGESSLSSHV